MDARESLTKGNRRDGHLWDYARFGIPITILTTVAGILLLLVLH